jgi:hypothetical protein
VSPTVIAMGFASLPVARAIAILRYRLYDIDVVINRTLVYGSLTALLGGGYLGLVLRGELTAVVADTMHPAHVSLWLRTRGEVPS